MNKQISTKEKLLAVARRLFWTRGYSNVSVRDITGEAGVDAALVSRYFGGKQGLFEETLVSLPRWDALYAEPDVFLDKTIETFSQAYDPKTDTENAFTMLLTNIIDPEMGETIQSLFKQGIVKPLADKIGGDNAAERAGMLLAVLFGAALMRKQFMLEGFAEGGSDKLRRQIKHLADAAMAFENSH